eukprot:NODE_798_length_4139_cov_0.212871.p1 type:complete len:468 gc:universal NODE_798_length_4139_cov_0.212871:2021-618(-)
MLDCSIIQTALTSLGFSISPDTNCCTNDAFRVTCDSNNHVLGINWDNLNLFGSLNNLPNKLSTLPKLKYVDISGNSGLSGLDDLCASSSITWLDISYTNNAMGCLPPALNALYMQSNNQDTLSINDICSTPLKVLDFSNNNIQTLPSCSWSYLKTLYGSLNQLSSISSLCSASLLSNLDISDNIITSFSCFPSNAARLNVRNNNVTSLNPVCASAKLAVLDAGFNNLMISDIPLCWNSSLTGIALDSNMINDISRNFTFLCSHSHVTFINLANNMLRNYPECINKLSDIAFGGNIFVVPVKTIDIIEENYAGFTRRTEVPKTFISTTEIITSTLLRTTATATSNAEETTLDFITTTMSIIDDVVVTVVLEQSKSPESTSIIPVFNAGSVKALLFTRSATEATSLLGIAFITFLVLSMIGAIVFQRMKGLTFPIIFGIIGHLGIIVAELHSFAAVEFGIALFEMGTFN